MYKIRGFKGCLKNGFTLAEVLITLGIIGVVAALTIPTLIANQKTTQTITALKNVYSTLLSAYNLTVQENGDPTNWDLISFADGQGALHLLAKFTPYLKVTKDCGRNTGCFPTATTYKLLKGTTYANYDFDTSTSYGKVILSDGTLLGFQVTDENCANNSGTTLALSNDCARVIADINGFKKPNQAGVDLFFFHITKYGLLPFGVQHNDTDGLVERNVGCNSKTSNGYGLGCAAWILQNDNMDYLKCSGLSWTGQISCN